MDKRKWLALMARIGLDHNISTYHVLLSHYQHKARYYHNANHINAVLAHLAKVESLANDYDAIELALWFHDAIYKVFSATNELDSANFSASFLTKNSANKELTSKVHALIMATEHNAIPRMNDEQLIVDIDLSILGCAPETYALFELWVRKEYRLVPNFIYRKKRKAILTGFLDRERIYCHQYFYQQLETSARTNIYHAIKQL